MEYSGGVISSGIWKNGSVLEGYFSCIFESGFLECLRMYFGMRAVQRAVQCISVNLTSNIGRSER